MYYTLEEARKLVIKAGLELVKSKLIARTWGNISARISKDEFVITPSGRAYESLKEEDLPIVNMNDLSYIGEFKPSSEKGIHAETYKLKEDCSFIIHTHQVYGTCLGLKGVNQMICPVAKYGLPSTKKLVKNYFKCLAENNSFNIIVLERHGIVSYGVSYEEAFKYAYELEETAKTFFKDHLFEHFNKVLKKPYLDDYAQVFFMGNSKVSEDEETINLLNEKNTMAAKVCKKPIRMNFFDCLIQHLVYKIKYSKLKK